MILATDGFEQSELTVPKRRLEEAGAKVDVVSHKPGEVRGWNHNDWDDPIKVDRTIDEVSADDYDALVIPGGQINPDLLRANPDTVGFVRHFYKSKKPIAAICHALAKGRKMTSHSSMATDVKNAGAIWVDRPVVVDRAVITSRNPGDLEAFSDKIIELVKEGRRAEREVA